MFPTWIAVPYKAGLSFHVHPESAVDRRLREENILPCGGTGAEKINDRLRTAGGRLFIIYKYSISPVYQPVTPSFLIQ